MTKSAGFGYTDPVTAGSETENLLRLEALEHDMVDTLAGMADRFYRIPETIYLDGNSLGLLSRDAEASLQAVLDQWRRLGVEGWTEAVPSWYTLAEGLAAGLGEIIGAEPGTVAVTNSTTVNLHQLLATLYQPQGKRTRILADALNFPSDLYALESHLRLRGRNPATDLLKVQSRDGRTLVEDDIIAAFSEEIAVAVLPSVLYTSGQLLDMARVTVAAHDWGILIFWDLAHSIGVVPHNLDALGVDAAFWCHYKYLNAGPGAVGGLYVNRRHWGKPVGLAGWWGSDKQRQFAMSQDFTPTTDAGALQIGTPPLLALAPLQGALKIHREAGMSAIRQKSLALTDFLRRAVVALLSPQGITIATPEESERRGGHLALIHPEAASLSRVLRRAGVVPDYRPPDILRLAPVPLYTTFADCLEAVLRLQTILQTEAYRTPEEDRTLVP